MEKTLKSSSVNYGLYLALGLVLYTVIFYAFNIELLVNFWVNLLIMPIVIIAFGVISSAKAKSLLGGFMSFKQAFTAYFIPIAIGVTISTAVTVILFNFIDPDSAEYLKEQVITKTQALMERMGAPSEQVNLTLAEMEKQDTFAFGTQLRSLAQSLIFFTVIGLLVALIMKKKDPNEA
ncbi:DUF4199 domain-containing protein [Psychroserpens mesophilus]|uniref:DUF4199 domain-containing protein n=1 Tax=Psychroserpens mesophilus TaxID=325473 RepID=UPI00058B8B6D|nr:DUF4199 domain-containing protein [Psychroserpens mesophilus]